MSQLRQALTPRSVPVCHFFRNANLATRAAGRAEVRGLVGAQTRPPHNFARRAGIRSSRGLSAG